MYYKPAFWKKIWTEYKGIKKIRNDDDVVPEISPSGVSSSFCTTAFHLPENCKNFGYQIPWKACRK